MVGKLSLVRVCGACGRSCSAVMADLFLSVMGGETWEVRVNSNS